MKSEKTTQLEMSEKKYISNKLSHLVFKNTSLTKQTVCCLHCLITGIIYCRFLFDVAARMTLRKMKKKMRQM